MKLLQQFVVCALILAITACASTRPALPEVKLPPERISQKGYSLMPLDEAGWLIAQRNKYALALVKTGVNVDETLAIQASISKIPSYSTNQDFVNAIKDGQEKDTDPQRFKILKHDVTSFPMAGGDCAKSYLVTEDHAAIKRSGSPGIMILEALTLSCAHPSERSIAVHVTYSHRHYPGQDDPAFMEKGNALINSVTLFEPDEPFISSAQKANMELAAKFSESCSRVIGQSASEQAETAQKKGEAPSEKLSSIGISIERFGNVNQIGAYALFEKGENGIYALSAIQPSYIETTDNNKQEELYISPVLDKVAPAFARLHFNDNTQAFMCETGSRRVTGIDSSYRAKYNPCDSSLTSVSNIGTSVLVNSMLTIASLGVNLATGSTVTYVDTDKDKVAKLIVESKLLQCLQKAKLNEKSSAQGSDGATR